MRSHIRFLALFSLLMFVSGTLIAQQRLPDYHSFYTFQQASPGALKTGLYGTDNPSLLKFQHQADMMFAWNDAARTPSSVKQWAGYLAFPGVGLGVMQTESAAGTVTDYTCALGFGSNAFALGLGYLWSSGNRAAFNRTDVVTAGATVRPNEYASIGFTGRIATKGDESEGIAEAAFRPFGDQLLTLFGDYAVRSDKSFNQAAWSAGAVAELFDGIRIAARYFDTKAVTVGFQFSFGNAGFAAQSHFSSSGNHAFNTYSVRAGAYDRNIFRSAVSARSKYVDLNLIGTVGYRRFLYFDKTQGILDLIRAIDAAKKDPAVAGIAINTSGFYSGKVMLWEVREKLKNFKSSGKKIVVFIDRADINLYHFASVADKIVMDPTGVMSLEGFVTGRTFLKGTLEKLGVGYDEWRFFKYKSAAESLSRDKMSDADREQRQALVDGWYAIAKNDITMSRNLTPDKFEALVNDRVLFLAQDAVAEGLVDTLGRWDIVKDLITKIEGDEKGRIPVKELERFNLPSDNRWGARPRIAVIYALGACAMDEGINARSLVKDVKAAVDDPSIKAIVLRVDSPGGDAMASDYIAEELKRAKGKKPVIVSQGEVAASGGYWLSMYADTIVAAPGTITGSIGVIGGWLYNAGLKEKLGFSTDFVKAGKHADLGFGFALPLLGGLPDRNMTPEERSGAERLIRTMYKDFVGKVASGREMSEDSIAQIAEGRVWTGVDGQRIGLVDILGGLETAISVARERSTIGKDELFDIVQYPAPGFIDFSAILPLPFSAGVAAQTDPFIEHLQFRLRHNGIPMPILQLDDIVPLYSKGFILQ